jgi:hemerythrin-like domain-containing protein
MRWRSSIRRGDRLISDADTPVVTDTWLLIHAVITHGLRSTRRASESLAQEGFTDERAREGFVRYVRSLVSVLDVHHLTEDELMFPYFRDLIPEAPFDTLSAEHKVMETHLESLSRAVEAGETVLANRQALEAVNAAAAEIDRIWHPHIATEQRFLTPKRIDSVIDREENARLSAQIAQYSQLRLSPDYLIVPFILFNLALKTRAKFARSLPPVVTEELVPKVWKKQWEPMTPYFVDER